MRSWSCVFFVIQIFHDFCVFFPFCAATWPLQHWRSHPHPADFRAATGKPWENLGTLTHHWSYLMTRTCGVALNHGCKVGGVVCIGQHRSGTVHKYLHCKQWYEPWYAFLGWRDLGFWTQFVCEFFAHRGTNRTRPVGSNINDWSVFIWGTWQNLKKRGRKRSKKLCLSTMSHAFSSMSRLAAGGDKCWAAKIARQEKPRQCQMAARLVQSLVNRVLLYNVQ